MIRVDLEKGNPFEESSLQRSILDQNKYITIIEQKF